MSETEHIRASAVIDASAEALFEKIADYRSAERLIDGLESMVPQGTVTSGEGARFSAVMRVGPRTFDTTIGITHYTPPSAITWSSSGSQSQALTFRFEPQEDGGRAGAGAPPEAGVLVDLAADAGAPADAGDPTGAGATAGAPADAGSSRSGGRRATRVTLQVSYERPGGLGGLLLAPVIEQTVRAKVTSTLERLRAAVA